MQIILAAAFAAILQAAAASPDSLVVLRPTQYDLNITVDIARNELVGVVRIRFENPAKAPVRRASLLLYRLMRAESVRDSAGRPLPFSQPVVEFEDHRKLQVRHIVVTLPKALNPGDFATVEVSYRGPLLGYVETGMLYIRDHIDSSYTLIRDDAFAYPILGVPSFKSILSAGQAAYQYHAIIRVPAGFTVANGGALLGKASNPKWTSFEYRNTKPAWRMDFAVARFTTLESGSLRIFHLPEDSAGGTRVMDAMRRTLDAFTRWFGPLFSSPAFTLIEIPDGWGSQADVSSILQAAAAFRDPARHYELYHEISHLWNVKPTDLPQPRWNEGLAVFMGHIATDSLERRATTDSSADRTGRRLQTLIKTNPRLAEVPMAKYGAEGMSGYSYQVGSLMFYTLHRLMGHESFTRLVGEYYRRYAATGGSTADFVRLAKEMSPVPISRVFDDWMYSTRWAELVATMPAHDLPKKY